MAKQLNNIYFFNRIDMNISLSTSISGRKTSGDEIRMHRAFEPDGFSEKIWIIFEGTQAGKELFDEICEQIFENVFQLEENSGESAIDRFEQAMRSLNKKIEEEAILPEDFLRKNSFAILLSVENEIHFTTLGTAEVYFIRAGKVMHVSEGIAAQNNTDELFLNVASGELQDGDIMIFSTLRLLRYVTHAQMQDIAQNNNSREILATIEEFIDIAQGGVTGSIVVEGDLPLPFEKTAIDHINIPEYQKKQKESSQFNFQVPQKISQFTNFLSKKVNGKIPQELLFLIIGIIVLFLIWSGISMIYGGMNNETQQYKTLLEEVDTDISIAHSMIKDGRKDEALNKLQDAEIKAKDAFHNSTFQADSQRYLKQITELKDNISDTTRISGQYLLDISGEMNDDILKGIFLFDEEMYAFGEKNLFRIIGNTLENIIPLKEEETVIAGIPLDKKQKMVFLTDRSALLEVSKTESSYAKTDDKSSWKKGINIGFFDRHIYLLSPENNEIYKYSRGNDTYSKPSAYNKGSDLSDAIDLTIDGNIFVLKKGGKVLKLLRGVEQDFVLENTPVEFANVQQIYTLPDLDLLLFLDPASNRIFIFQKNDNTAIFEQQIIIDSEDEVLSGLWFDLNANRIIVSGKHKIYEVPLTR